MVVAQVIAPDSKLAIARGLREETAASSLGEVLGVGGCDEDDLYAAMDWLAARQQKIEDALAARHLAGGTLVLYDVSSAAFEGRTCPLGAIGHPKDGVRGRLQIVYGLLTTKDGVPVAIEVFAGNTGDPKTVAAQVTKLKDRFGLARVVLVGRPGHAHRGAAREDVGPAQLDCITALRAPQIKAWSRPAPCSCPCSMHRPGRDHPPRLPRRAASGLQEPVPGSRAGPQTRNRCWPPPRPTWPRSPRPARGHARPLRGKDKIALRAGKVINHYKVAKHFAYHRRLTFTGRGRSPPRPPSTASTCCAPASPPVTWPAPASSPPTRPSPRSNGSSAPSTPTWTSAPSGTAPNSGSAPTCSCACCPTTSPGTCRPSSRPSCSQTTTSQPPRPPGPARSPPPPAPQSTGQSRTKRTDDDVPVHSFASLLSDLATICLNTIQPADPALPGFRLVTTPTAVQRQALDLLGVSHRLGAS